MQQKTRSQLEQEQRMEAAGLNRDDLVRLYEECQEKLTEVEGDLMDGIDRRVEISPEFIHRIFRSFHGVKGAAAHLLHEPMKTLSHAAENLLSEVREGRIELSVAVAEVLLTTISRLKEMADDVDRRQEIDYQFELESLLAILKPQRVLLDLNEESADIVDRSSVNKIASEHRLKVLVVEDDFTSRVVLQGLLSRYGDCHVAVNGSEAVEAFQFALSSGVGYDLICMDVRMPVMDGTEAVRQIRLLEENAGTYSSDGVKIFMTTGVRDTKTVTAAFKALCDTYLYKPVSGSQLEEHLLAFGLIGQEEIEAEKRSRCPAALQRPVAQPAIH
jgi:two-component system chemotaxis response regulator CheY